MTKCIMNMLITLPIEILNRYIIKLTKIKNINLENPTEA